MKKFLVALLLCAVSAQASITVVSMTKVPHAGLEVYKAMSVTPSSTAATKDTIVFVPSSASAFDISNVAGDSGQVNVYFNLRASASDSTDRAVEFQVTAHPSPRIGSYVANEWILVKTVDDTATTTCIDRFRTMQGINRGDPLRARFVWSETTALVSVSPFDVVVYWRKAQARQGYAD